MIKYLGSKRTLIPQILDAVRAVSGECGPVAGGATVLDLFSGTSRVGHALKSHGYRVVANDHNAYAHTLAKCYVQADRAEILQDAEQLIAEFNSLPGKPGYVTENFCIRSRYFHPSNGERIDAIRDAIAAKCLGPELEAVLLVSLMEAADRVDSTTGVQMAYLKEYAPRALRPMTLRMPAVIDRPLSGKCEAHRMDALEAAEAFEADVAYIDPPYNQHSYLGNYHVWETLVLWDKPETYGIACKRVDVRTRRSCFNFKVRFEDSFSRLLSAVRAKALVISFSNEGYLSPNRMVEMLGELWGGDARVRTVEVDYRRYVGAQIGIYNPAGEKVGKVSHLKNKEYLFLVERGSTESSTGSVVARLGGSQKIRALAS